MVKAKVEARVPCLVLANHTMTVVVGGEVVIVMIKEMGGVAIVLTKVTGTIDEVVVAVIGPGAQSEMGV